jgi:hypothetical protein
MEFNTSIKQEQRTYAATSGARGAEIGQRGDGLLTDPTAYTRSWENTNTHRRTRRTPFPRRTSYASGIATGQIYNF